MRRRRIAGQGYGRAARAARRAAQAAGAQRGAPCLLAELQEALDRGLLVIEPLGERVSVLGGHLKEVLDAALGVIGERIDAREVLLGARDPERRAALGERARPAHRRDDEM